MADTDHEIEMEGVREYSEERAVYFNATDDHRPVAVAYNEGGHNCTQVDIKDLVEWLKANRPELLS